MFTLQASAPAKIVRSNWRAQILLSLAASLSDTRSCYQKPPGADFVSCIKRQHLISATAFLAKSGGSSQFCHNSAPSSPPQDVGCLLIQGHEVVSVDEARYWIIGLVVVSLLTVGVVTVLGPAEPVEELANNDWGTPPAGASGWGSATPNFAAGEVTDEHQGGSGNNVGWGKLTVSDVCLQQEIDPELAVSRLGEYELPMNLTQRIRELADLGGHKPSEVIDILLGNVLGECDGDCDGDCDHGSDHEHDDSDAQEV